MKKNRHTTEQVIEKLRQADVLLGKGQPVSDICKAFEITSQTYYRWRQKYGGMAPEMAKELKTIQKENARLKKLVAEQALDMEILKEAARGNWPRFWSKGPNGSVARLLACVAVWGLIRFQSVEFVGCLINHAVRIVTRDVAFLMNKRCLQKCVALLAEGPVGAALGCMRNYASVAGE